jgi:NAD(P)H-dependent flavin oxidoreductase YrpB (nitropropane dioxygenase family)
MRTPLCKTLGIAAPIFAFSHCRDVVVEASRSGGFGVLGAATYSPEQLEQELSWIDKNIRGKPYGIDIIMPNETDVSSNEWSADMDFDKVLPAEHRQFVEQVLDKLGVPRLSDADKQAYREYELAWLRTHHQQGAGSIIDVALRHPVKLIVNALGIPPRPLIDRLHGAGVKVAAMVGAAHHAIKQKAAGVDIIIAVGTEAGGHTGDISTMVLTPRVVDAVAPVPVLAGGGIARGRQVAAALALGAQGVWCGSVWLGTAQSDLTPDAKKIIFASKENDTVRRRVMSGKPVRMIPNKYTEAWETPGAPAPLPYPLQPLLNVDPMGRAKHFNRADLMFQPAGQVVADLKDETSVRQIFHDMLNEFAEAVETLRALTDDTESTP